MDILILILVLCLVVERVVFWYNKLNEHKSRPHGPGVSETASMAVERAEGECVEIEIEDISDEALYEEELLQEELNKKLADRDVWLY